MKRLIALTLVLFLLLAACGSGESAANGEGPTATLYYMPVVSGGDWSQALEGVTLSLDAEGDAVEQVLTALWTPPDIGRYTAALPQTVSLDGVELVGDGVALHLSAAYGELTAPARSLALAAIVHSLCSLDNVEHVTLYAGDTLVAEALSADDFLLYDKEADPYERQVKIYFPDSSAKFLYGYPYLYTVGRDVDIEAYVLQELLRGAEDIGDVVSFIPEGTEALEVYTESGTCFVSFSDVFFSDMPDTYLKRRAVVYAIVNSLTSIAGIDSVQLLRNGESVVSYGEIPLDQPLTLNEHIQGGSGDREVTLFLYCEQTETLVSIPIMAEAAEGDLAVVTILNTVLAAGNEAGYRTPIPAGTTLADPPEIQDRILNINLSSEFLEAGTAEMIELALTSIARSLSDQIGLDGIRVLVNGQDIIVDGVSFSDIIYF